MTQRVDPAVDPRVERTRRDVLGAAHDVLLEEGSEQVTVARIAERSGYARTTLYRHWPRRLDLLRDLIRDEARLLHSTPTGELRTDLLAELEAFRVALTGTCLGRAMIAIGQRARDDSEFADLNRSVRDDGARVLSEIVATGVASNELRDDLDADVAVAQLVGPVLFRYLFEETLPLDRRFVTRVVDSFLTGARPRT